MDYYSIKCFYFNHIIICKYFEEFFPEPNKDLQCFLKEFALAYDQLLNTFAQNYSFHLYLSNLNIFTTHHIDPSDQSIQPPSAAVESFYEQIEHFEDTLLFIAILVTKFYTNPTTIDKTLSYLNLAEVSNKSNKDSETRPLHPLPFINVILDLIEVCGSACNLPLYLNYAPSVCEDFSKLSQESNNDSVLEFYEFILAALQAYSVALESVPAISDNLNYFLVSQLSEEKTSPQIRTILSRDLLLFICNRSSVSYVQSLFGVYEFLSHCPGILLCFESLLLELVETNAADKTFLSSLEDYFSQQKMYHSFALIAGKFGSKQSEGIATNSVSKLNDFLAEFEKFLEGLGKGKNGSDQVILKKVTAFMISKHGFQLMGKLKLYLQGDFSSLSNFDSS